MAWQQGEKVGQYVLDTQLGQGGMATVYKAYHEPLDRTVALKVMHQNFLDDETFISRFRREAQLVARLSHPNIVSVYDFGEHQGQPYLVMKYVPGFTLKKQMIKNPPTLQGTIDIVKAVASALSYAHEQDILHRDIKPSNIVINQEGIVYLTDFGLARLASSGESTMSADMLLGTPHYISPEQARGERDLDGRADIYSLGVVLYEMLVGHVPFTADTPYAIIHDHIYRPLPPPSQINPDIPEQVEAVLFKALDKAATNRYSTANEMANDLQTALDNSNLSELNEDRKSVAIQSLAKQRQAYIQQLADQQTITDNIPVESPQKPKKITASQPIIVEPTAWYQDKRVYPVGGCGVFLFVLFLMAGIILDISGAVMEIVSLEENFQQSFSEGLVVGHEIGLREIITSDMRAAGVDYLAREIPYYRIPILSITRASQIRDRNPDNPLTALLISRAYYQTDNIDQARDNLLAGLDAAEEPLVYLASARELTLAADDDNAAYTLTALLLQLASTDEIAFNILREPLGEYLYEERNNLDLLTVDQLRTMLSPVQTYDITAADFLTTDSARWIQIAKLIDNQNYELARQRFSQIDEDTPFYPEFALLRAQVTVQLGNQEQARTVLFNLLETPTIPQWVQKEAEDLLDELTN